LTKSEIFKKSDKSNVFRKKIKHIDRCLICLKSVLKITFMGLLGFYRLFLFTRELEEL
jgi:hypothetical protein